MRCRTAQAGIELKLQKQMWAKRIGAVRFAAVRAGKWPEMRKNGCGVAVAVLGAA